ncbi:DUF1707 SHOCT-like domain-containing protein [Pseudonocardia sp. HH130630-07]|uniref:DUF1707 SHOCT-like domain-containing protein n=1 Tax=Pseudonocardia sp. HH130630-07 TaxID=1690815 RepID=UPI0018D339E8|nr:DUF1707 domain-containing protein [Pseudonocardia sp. HH130630-07]
MTDGSEIRVGDADRRAVDDVLQRAHGEGRLSLEEYEERSALVWAARTRADLAPLTRDLPAGGDLTRPVAAEPAPRSRAADLAATAARSVGSVLGAVALVAAAVWGGSELLTAQDGAAVFSSRTVGVGPGQDRVETRSLFGSVRVVVPDGTRAELSGLTLFGSTECPTACAAPGPGTVAVDASGLFTSVEVLTPAESAATPMGSDREDRGNSGDGDDD